MKLSWNECWKDGLSLEQLEGWVSVQQASHSLPEQRKERGEQGGRKEGQKTDVVGLTDYSIADPTKCLVRQQELGVWGGI